MWRDVISAAAIAKTPLAFGHQYLELYNKQQSYSIIGSKNCTPDDFLGFVTPENYSFIHQMAASGMMAAIYCDFTNAKQMTEMGKWVEENHYPPGLIYGSNVRLFIRPIEEGLLPHKTKKFLNTRREDAETDMLRKIRDISLPDTIFMDAGQGASEREIYFGKAHDVITSSGEINLRAFMSCMGHQVEEMSLEQATRQTLPLVSDQVLTWAGMFGADLLRIYHKQNSDRFLVQLARGAKIQP